MTLYFAKEVPLAPKQPDSAPLLQDLQINESDPLTSKTEKHNSPRRYTMDNGEEKHQENNHDNFSDSPGAVLVNLLTSLRHLPPAMHSVLVVMALTWVCVSLRFFCSYYLHVV